MTTTGIGFADDDQYGQWRGADSGPSGGQTRPGHREAEPHPAYRRLADSAPRDDAAPGGRAAGDGVPDGSGMPGSRPGAGVPPPQTHRPSPGPLRTRMCQTEVCSRCDAPTTCCHCAADVSEVRRFATRMAMIHQSTGTAVCGCGARNCYVRTRLDAIWHRFWQ